MKLITTTRSASHTVDYYFHSGLALLQNISKSLIKLFEFQLKISKEYSWKVNGGWRIKTNCRRWLIGRRSSATLPVMNSSTRVGNTEANNATTSPSQERADGAAHRTVMTFR